MLKIDIVEKGDKLEVIVPKLFHCSLGILNKWKLVHLNLSAGLSLDNLIVLTLGS